MIPCSRFFQVVLVVLVFSIDLNSAVGQDWPQWRGSQRDGVLVPAIKQVVDQPKLNWTSDIAAGYSGPTVANGRVYLMDRIDAPKQIERVHCLDEKSGKPIWTHEYEAVYKGIGYTAGPRASVTVFEGQAYSIGSMGHAFCFDAATGEVVWQKDFNAEYSILTNKRMPIWGIAGSPLVTGGNVVFHVGGSDGACVVALDRKTGKETWRALKDRAQYSAPVLMDQNGRQSIVCWTGDSVAALKPDDGTVLWRYEFKPRNMPIGVATPVIQDDKIFVTSFYDGSLMLKVSDDGNAVKKVWAAVGTNERATQSLHSIISTPIWIGDYIYGVDSYGQLRCLEAGTGERVWENLDAVPRARWSTIHFVKNGDDPEADVWMFNERGELMLGKLTPEGFEEISRNKIIEPTTNQLRQRGGVCWSHPAFANGNIIIRNDKQIKSWSLAK